MWCSSPRIHASASCPRRSPNYQQLPMPVAQGQSHCQLRGGGHVREQQCRGNILPVRRGPMVQRDRMHALLRMRGRRADGRLHSPRRHCMQVSRREDRQPVRDGYVILKVSNVRGLMCATMARRMATEVSAYVGRHRVPNQLERSVYGRWAGGCFWRPVRIMTEGIVVHPFFVCCRLRPAPSMCQGQRRHLPV